MSAPVIPVQVPQPAASPAPAYQGQQVSFPVSSLPAAAQQQPAQPAQPAPVNPNPQPAPVQQAPIDVAHMRVQAAPGIPADLVGKTMSEVFAYTSMLQQNLMNRTQQPVPQPVQQQPQPQQPAQPVGSQKTFYQDPEGHLQKLVEEMERRTQVQIQAAVGSVNAPIQIQAAQQQAAATFGQHWPTVAATVAARLAGAPQQLLSDPQTWLNMGNMVLGDMARSGQLPVSGAAPAPQQMVVGQPAPSQTQLNSGQAWQPAFTEAPSGQGGASAVNRLTPVQIDTAKKMGISLEEYAAWNGGGR